MNEVVEALFGVAKQAGPVPTFPLGAIVATCNMFVHSRLNRWPSATTGTTTSGQAGYSSRAGPRCGQRQARRDNKVCAIGVTSPPAFLGAWTLLPGLAVIFQCFECTEHEKHSR